MFSTQYNIANYSMLVLPVYSTTYRCACVVFMSADYFSSSFNCFLIFYYFDFNNDGVFDTVVLGRVVPQTDPSGETRQTFVRESDFGAAGISDEADVLGVYFNANEVASQPPDLVRLRDRELRINQQAGLLTSLSLNDYRNTDILVFREATGELVVERRGFRDEEAPATSRLGLDGQQRFFYNMISRGPSDSQSFSRPISQFEEFNRRNGLTESFQRRDGDFLRPGETVQVVAINRATGYLGTARVRLDNSQSNPGGAVSIVVPDIVMRPPNLKVWAMRDFTVEQGLSQGEDRSLTIGSEGAALTSDTTVRILTEWLDHDGSPLPDGLSSDNGADFGYTGRLARIVAPGTLGGAAVNSDQNSDLAEFPIRPGLQTQAITVASNLTRPEHYYVHVIGMAENQHCVAGMSCPDFDTPGTTTPFDTRPRLLTPFMVPLFDEQDTFDQLNAFNAILRNQQNQEGQGEPVQPNRPLPSYVWQYRPEYQFSQFELAVQEINRINEGEAPVNLLAEDQPSISAGDDLVEILFDLLGPEFERLRPIDGEQEFVLALGGEEVLLTSTSGSSQVRFDNLAQLDQLNAEDLLSIRLYTNNDAGNILFEYGFGSVNAAVDLNRDGVVSLGDSPLTLAEVTEGSNSGSGGGDGSGGGSAIVASITLDPNITADDIIDATEANGNITITGIVGGSLVQDGDTVTLTINGNTFSGTVSNNAFSISVSGADLAADAHATIEALITTTDNNGNTVIANDTEGFSIKDPLINSLL